MTAYASLPVAELAAMLRSRNLSSLTLTIECLNVIRARNSKLGAFLTVTEEKALAAARLADQRLANGSPLSPLDGIPYALKDNFLTRGIETTAASKMLSGFIPPCSATVVDLLEKAGCILLGKCNMDEFGIGSTTANSAITLTRNPHDSAYVPGGSSGGSAAAVAAGMAVFAIGSDTGGSVRLPAAFCGITGLKPSYGVISRYGLIAFASSLDTVGILANRPSDCLAVTEILARKDPRDMTSGTNLLPEDETDARPPILLAEEYNTADIGKEIRVLLSSAASVLESYGYPVQSVSIPELNECLAAYEILSSAEASSNLARFDGVRYGHRSDTFTDVDSLYENSRTEGFGNEVKRRILMGTYFLSNTAYNAYYRAAERTSAAVRQALLNQLRGNTLLLCPASPTGAFRFSETPDAISLRKTDLCLVPANLAGLPAVAIPCGRQENGMPLSLQLIAGNGRDRTLCRQAETVLQLLQRGLS